MGSYRLRRSDASGVDQQFDAMDDAVAVTEAKLRVRRYLDAGFNPGRPIGWEVQRPSGADWSTFLLCVSR